MNTYNSEYCDKIYNSEKEQTLTVTVTLFEYRELLRCSYDLECANAKIEELENINKIYAQMFLKEHPELADNFSKDLQYMIDKVVETVRESENPTEKSDETT